MKLQSILMPLSEFDHAEKGDALYGKFVSVLLCCNPIFVVRLKSTHGASRYGCLDFASCSKCSLLIRGKINYLAEASMCLA